MKSTLTARRFQSHRLRPNCSRPNYSSSRRRSAARLNSGIGHTHVAVRSPSRPRTVSALAVGLLGLYRGRRRRLHPLAPFVNAGGPTPSRRRRWAPTRRWRPPIARSCLQARHASAIQLLRGLRQAARNKAVMSVANRRTWRTWRSTGRRPALQVQAHNSSVPLTLLVRRHCCPYARSQRIQDFETANSSQ